MLALPLAFTAAMLGAVARNRSAVVRAIVLTDRDVSLDAAGDANAGARVWVSWSDAPAGQSAVGFLASHEGELVTRIAYWTGEGPGAVRALLRVLQDRAARMELRATGLEAATLIELTAFGTAVMMHWRYTRVFRSTHHEASR